MSDTHLIRPNSVPWCQLGPTNVARAGLHRDARPPPQASGSAPPRLAPPATVRDEEQSNSRLQAPKNTPNDPQDCQGSGPGFSLIMPPDSAPFADSEVRRLTTQLAMYVTIAEAGNRATMKTLTSDTKSHEAIATLARQRDRTGQALLQLVASTTSPTIPNYEDRLRQHAAIQGIEKARRVVEPTSLQRSTQEQHTPIPLAWTGRAGSAMREELASWLPQLCTEQLRLAFEAGRNSEHGVDSRLPVWFHPPSATELCSRLMSSLAGEADTNRIFHNSARWAGKDEELRYTISSVPTDPISAGYFSAHSKWYKKQYMKLEARVQALEAAFLPTPPEETTTKLVRDHPIAKGARSGPRGDYVDLLADSSADRVQEQVVTEVSHQLAPGLDPRPSIINVMDGQDEVEKRIDALEDSIKNDGADARQHLGSSDDGHQEGLHQIEHNLRSWLNREHSSLRAECNSRQDAVLYGRKLDEKLEQMIESALESSGIVDCVEELQNSFKGLKDSLERLQQDHLRLSDTQSEDTSANDVIIQGQTTKIAQHERILGEMSKATDDTAIAIKDLHMQLNNPANDGVDGIENMRAIIHNHGRQLVELARTASDYQTLVTRLAEVETHVDKPRLERLESTLTEHRKSFTLRLEGMQERLELQDAAIKLLRDKQDATAHEIQASIHPALTQILALVTTI
ncbi:BQ5605_C018g08758 [Microbotryum silenes-dioicae]|uniref:BQ5605_C018g08758 protein n=1 Tax=Microbotryum silenes-dioicae TaxID=796604 RepID=A0A2X0M0V2_9BASI|nr:BQ5605_C018g08758 [Microbotryum silenes-dioicae]